MPKVVHEPLVRGGPFVRHNRWSRRPASRDGLRDRFWRPPSGRFVLRDRGGVFVFGSWGVEDPKWRAHPRVFLLGFLRFLVTLPPQVFFVCPSMRCLLSLSLRHLRF